MVPGLEGAPSWPEPQGVIWWVCRHLWLLGEAGGSQLSLPVVGGWRRQCPARALVRWGLVWEVIGGHRKYLESMGMGTQVRGHLKLKLKKPPV